MKVEVLNREQFRNILYNGKVVKDCFKTLPDDIKFFSFSCVNTKSKNELFLNSLRFIVAYDDNNIYGILKMAKSIEYYCLLYLSVNENFKGIGISKLLLKEMVGYLSENETITTTEFTEEGWNFIRKNLNEMCKVKNIKVVDNILK